MKAGELLVVLSGMNMDLPFYNLKCVDDSSDGQDLHVQAHW